MTQTQQYDPERLSSHTIAKAIRYYFLWPDDRERYAQRLLDRFSCRIEETVADAYFSPATQKPSRGERDTYHRKVEAFRAVLSNNIDHLLGRIFERGSIYRRKDDHPQAPKFIPAVNQPSIEGLFSGIDYGKIKLTEEQREANRQTFRRLMQEEIGYLPSQRRFNHAVQDYEAVAQFREDQTRFNILETMCSSVLRGFVRRHANAEFHADDLYQEGLLVVAACAQQYEARDFARFSSMVRTGLRHKFINLLRYNAADRRRINKEAAQFSTLDDGSRTGQEVDEATYQGWLLAQRQQEYSNNGCSPFVTLSPFDIVDPRYDTTAVLEARVGSEEAAQHNFPHLNESEVNVYFNGSWFSLRDYGYHKNSQ